MLLHVALATLWSSTGAATVVSKPPPPPPPPPAGIAFNASFGSYMVLQQAPAKACVGGILGEGGTAASVTIKSSTDLSTGAHTVAAEITADGGGWKACLPAAAVGGDHTITATCTGCTNTTAAVLEHVTYGDVWYCSGQSNMALRLQHTYSRNSSRDAILAGKYSNIRIHGLKGNMNPFQPWATLKQALATPLAQTSSDDSSFMAFSASCYYFGQSGNQEGKPSSELVPRICSRTLKGCFVLRPP